MEYDINLTAYLSEFTDKVSQKEYVKMPYDIWRQLNYYAKKDKIETRLIYDFNSDKIKIAVSGRLAPMQFNTEDSSFGEFLWQKYLILRNTQTLTIQPNNSDIAISVDNLKADKGTSYLAVYESNATFIDGGNVRISGQPVEDNIKSTIDETLYSIKQKENNNMSNLFKGFEFGTCANDKVKMSLYGLAVQNATGTWVSYDPASATIIDVDPFNYEGGKYLYKMPVAIKDVKEGDLVIHNRKPMFVVDVKDGIKAVDIAAGEEKNIIPTRNMFGFDFITRVTSLFDIGGFNKPNADQPFGNMLPLMLLAGEGNTDDMLPLMFMMNGSSDLTANPMMMYFLMKDSKNSDMLPLMFLMNNNK